ncbi:hypothetical protein A3Q56_00320 [Intoshia linei]|uniref:Cation-dependent mannose-6-phosphate receptor n=1 Tax=Intoshia linei TaxID=1819745 RepID=A0A177BEB4_9BILA|nr:hypothetical protein A3Q56_00320 [Intoshia linei]
MNLNMILIKYLVFYLINGFFAKEEIDHKCKFKQQKHLDDYPKFKLLIGRQYEYNSPDDSIKFYVAICTNVKSENDNLINPGTQGIGAYYIKNNNQAKITRTGVQYLGSLNNADINKSDYTTTLSYRNENYEVVNSVKSAVINIVCTKQKSLDGKMELTSQFQNQYIFVIYAKEICDNLHEPPQLSISLSFLSVIILNICVLIYLFFGIILNKMKGESGWYLIPQRDMWKMLGELIFDGTALIFASNFISSKYNLNPSGYDDLMRQDDDLQKQEAEEHDMQINQ